MSSKIYIRIPAQNPLSPVVSHVPDSMFKRIRKAGRLVLRNLLKVAETDANHELYQYDAQEAKAEFDSQLCEYARANYPFHRPLGQNEPVLEYWRSLKSLKNAFMLAVSWIRGFIVHKLS